MKSAGEVSKYRQIKGRMLSRRCKLMVPVFLCRVEV